MDTQSDILNEPVDDISNFEKVLNYQGDGYLFHGSDNPDIDVLEPRLAKDSSGNTFNSDTAVYASSNPQVCIMGIVSNSFKGLKGSWNLGNKGGSDLTAEIPSTWRDFVEKSHGILYVLPSNTFVKASPNAWQAKSTEPVKPVDKVELSFDDYLALGGKVVWKDNE